VEAPESAVATGRRDAGRAGRMAPVFGALGLLSGALVVGLKLGLDEAGADFRTGFELLGLAFGIDDLTLLPGIVFGIVIGGALGRHGIAGPARIGLYALAATAANFAATNLAYMLADGWHGLAIGMVAGALGAFLLTAATLALFPACRRAGPAALMVASGAMLGMLLSVTLYLIDRDTVSAYLGLLVLYAPWQGAYAAAFGHGLDN